MTDLIDEASSDLSQFGYTVKKDGKYDIEIGTLNVDSQSKSQRLGFEKGEYVILNSPLTYMLDQKCHAYVAKLLKKHLENLFKKNKLDKGCRFFVVGIGNPDILADSLGKRVVDKVAISSTDPQNRIFKLCPNIFFNTGISTFDIVSKISHWLEVDCVIVIDSLATSNISRLGISFQINTAGLTPGSALKQENKKLCSKNLGAKVLSIGVPFMIFASDLNSLANKDLILTAKDIHEQIEIASNIIAQALSGALNWEER